MDAGGDCRWRALRREAYRPCYFRWLQMEESRSWFGDRLDNRSCVAGSVVLRGGFCSCGFSGQLSFLVQVVVAVNRMRFDGGGLFVFVRSVLPLLAPFLDGGIIFGYCVGGGGRVRKWKWDVWEVGSCGCTFVDGPGILVCYGCLVDLSLES